jgi:hypothetical protein
MDRIRWLSSLAPGAHALLESTDPRVRSVAVIIESAGPEGICASGIRFNAHGKKSVGDHVWSLVPMLGLVKLLEVA